MNCINLKARLSLLENSFNAKNENILFVDGAFLLFYKLNNFCERKTRNLCYLYLLKSFGNYAR